MSTRVDNLYDFKLDIYHALNYAFNRTVPSSFGVVDVSSSNRLIDGSVQASRHNFSRDKMQWHNPNDIYYNGIKLARTQSKPHKTILIYAVSDKYRLAKNILLKTLHDNFPEAKVIYER